MKSKVNNTNRKNIEAAFQNPLGMEIRNNQEIREAIANHAKSIIEKLHEERKKMIFVKKYLIIDAEREFGISLPAHFVKYAYIRCTSKGDINEKALVYSAEELVGKDVTVLNEYSV